MTYPLDLLTSAFFSRKLAIFAIQMQKYFHFNTFFLLLVSLIDIFCLFENDSNFNEDRKISYFKPP